MILLVIIIFGLMTMNNAQTNSELDNAKHSIVSMMKSFPGDYAVYFEEVGNKKSVISINAEETFHAASTMKTPVMLEIFKQSAEGKFDLDDSLTIINSFKSIVDRSSYSLDIADDSGDDLYKLVGTKKKIRELLVDMITMSGNLSTNILIELVKAENVMSTLNSYEINNVKVYRGVQDLKAFDVGLNNTVTAIDLAKIFLLLGRNEFISKNICDDIVNILLKQKHRSIIPKLLPDNVKVANKTGSRTGVNHDSGIILLPNGRKYVLVILGKNITDRDLAIRMQSEVSKRIYDYFQSLQN
ncbi:MAG: serine hydrolase [Ignavibacteriaceae bacterium]|nr:serine hydrolase [Ignavibacteriaceae bacterium]